jgi:hypothetical protein
MKKIPVLQAAVSAFLLLLAPTACEKQDCADPWGIVGNWISVEHIRQYRDGVLTADIPGSWNYTFRADGTGERGNVAQTYPFEWFYADDNDRLVIVEPNGFAGNGGIFTKSFSLLDRTDHSLQLRDSTFFDTRLPPDFVQTQRLTTVYAVRLLGD